MTESSIPAAPRAGRSAERIRSDLILLLVAFVWGSAFVVQRATANNIGVFWFTGLRFLLAALLLLPFALRSGLLRRAYLPWMLAAGLVLFAGTNLQQLALRYTTAGNAGVITGLYVVFVPFILVFVLRRRLHLSVWIAAVLSVLGLLLLSSGGKLQLARGDAIVVVGAVFWAVHMVIIDAAVQKVPVLPLAVGQYIVNGLLNLLFGLLIEPAGLGGLVSSWWAVVYAGAISVGVGYTLQAVGQRHAPPTDAALILSTEAVFAALFGYLFLNETLSLVQLSGCALIMAAILMVQIWNKPAPAA